MFFCGGCIITVTTLFFELLTNPHPFQLRQVINEQLAIEMIDLVLDANRQQIVGFHLERLAIPVQCPSGVGVDGHMIWPSCLRL